MSEWNDYYGELAKLVERGYSFLFEYGDYDYSWEIVQVWVKGRHFFNLADSGCSCYSFGEGWHSVDAVIGEFVEVSSLPSLESLGGYDEKAEAIQQKYRELGLR